MSQLSLSALSFEVAQSVTTEAHLLPAQDFVVDDGRGDVGLRDRFIFNADVAARLIARFNAKKNETVVDYEHQSLLAAQNGKEAPAAGWFKTLEYRDTGLWATNIKWVKKAKDYIANAEYRYISAVFSFDVDTGEIFELINFTLTNTPAKDGLQALAGLSHQFNLDPTNSNGDLIMSGGKDVSALTAELNTATTQVTALTQDLATANTKISALSADLKAANDKLAAAEAEKQAALVAAEKKQHADLLQTALSDGRLTPKQKDWASGLSLAQLTDYLAAAPVILDGKLQHDKTVASGDQLTAEEIAMCTSMQIDQAEFLKTKLGK